MAHFEPADRHHRQDAGSPGQPVLRARYHYLHLRCRWHAAFWTQLLQVPIFPYSHCLTTFHIFLQPPTTFSSFTTFQNLPLHLSFFHNLLQPSTTFYNLPQPPTTSHNLPQPPTTSHYILPLSTTSHHILHPNSTFHNLPQLLTTSHNNTIQYKNEYYYSGINPVEFRGHNLPQPITTSHNLPIPPTTFHYLLDHPPFSSTHFLQEQIRRRSASTLAFQRLLPLLHDCLPHSVWRVDRKHVELHLLFRPPLHPLLPPHHDHRLSRRQFFLFLFFLLFVFFQVLLCYIFVFFLHSYLFLLFAFLIFNSNHCFTCANWPRSLY